MNPKNKYFVPNKKRTLDICMYYQKKSISTLLRQYSESSFTYIRLKCEKIDYFEYLAQISRLTESQKINIFTK